MVYSENAINILTAKTFKGIGRAWIVKNLRGNETVNTIVSSLNKNLKEDYTVTVEGFEASKERIKEKIRKLEDDIDGIVAIGDKNFPQYRGNVKNSEQPIVLFYKGNLSLLEIKNKNIAVIGLLEPDNEIEKNEKEVVSELVKRDATIVSGLALGCDTIAHRQALDSNGKTVAILPSPLNNIMPRKNKELAKEIVNKNGLLVSEYYEDVNSKNELGSRYNERDRLQALFSDCIILSASYAKNNQGFDSGSRLAMGYALNYSIPRAVIYDKLVNNNNPKYDLTRQLINEQKDLSIINPKNSKESINEVIFKGENKKINSVHQKTLFD